ncbi:MAG: type I secretion C-terminal target domain-containing protein, partial [Verrucomicrobiales bacterium]
FTESDVIFYGEVRQVGGAGTVLLQSGDLEVTMVNRSVPDNRVTLETSLKPTGTAEGHRFSYSLEVPLAYLPADEERTTTLAIETLEADFRIESIKIDGREATLSDGSREFFQFSFASRAMQHRLDLIVAGDSTDTDGDGLPDWWEEMHGLDPQVDDADLDPDADGWSNLDEFAAGADPNESNRDPSLATWEILVPESGRAGVHFAVLDSDTAPVEQMLVLTIPAEGGFEFQFDGQAAVPGDHEFSLADLAGGRVTVSHADPAVSELMLQSDLGGIVVRATIPSAMDGSDAALWLDAGGLVDGGDGLDRWGDRSGNDNGIYQPSTDYRPRLQEHASGLTTVDFSHSNEAHLFFPDSVLPAGDHTILASYQAGSRSGSAQTLFASNRGFFQVTPTTETISYPGSPVYQADGAAVHAYTRVIDEPTTTSVFRQEGDLLQHIFGVSYDGESSPAVGLEPRLPTIGGVRAADSVEGGLISDPFSGQLHELLVFPTALPEQKLRDVTDYLESKWSDAVIWDFSTDLRAVSISLGAGSQPNIIRGGHGDDQLGGGESGDVISGGPGNDRLVGGGGEDCFVFGSIDTGRDVIADFDLDEDTIDLSALFWDMRGDVREFLSVRLESNFSSEIPTLDSVFVVESPEAGALEIRLEGVAVGATELIQLVVEGRVRMGGLSIPTSVQIARASAITETQEHLGESFEMTITRDGEAAEAALEVPIGFFRDAFGSDFIVEEANSQEGRRAVISFARGETERTLTVRPIADLTTEGEELWEIAAIPHFRYSIEGDAVQQQVSDVPLVRLDVIESDGIVSTGQVARLALRRDGNLDGSLAVPIRLGGSAVEGRHFERLPESIVIPAGQASAEIVVIPIPDGLVDQAQMVLVTLGENPNYQLSSPHEASIFLARTEGEVEGLGFERWLASNGYGPDSGLEEIPPSALGSYLHEYTRGSQKLGFRLIGGHPELSLIGDLRPDIAWAVESSSALQGWED